jgi:hypothetical protein
LRIPADANGALENCAQLTGENARPMNPMRAPASPSPSMAMWHLPTATATGRTGAREPIEPEPEPQRTRDLSLTANGQSGCTSGNGLPGGFVVRNAGGSDL